MAKTNRKADLQALHAAIAASPILVAAIEAGDFAEWCRRQYPANIDTIILDWLRAQAVQPAAVS